MKSFVLRRLGLGMASFFGVVFSLGTAWADVSDIVVHKVFGPMPIVPGNLLYFGAVDDGLWPAPIDVSFSIRPVDEDVTGAWENCENTMMATFPGEYDVKALVSYMPNPGEPPSKTIGPERFTVHPPDKITFYEPGKAVWEGKPLEFNKDYNVQFQINAKGMPAYMDASTVAEERLTPWGPTGYGAPGDWKTELPKFGFVGGCLIDELKRFNAIPAQYLAWPPGKILGQWRQEIRLTYTTGTGKIVTTPPLITFTIVFQKMFTDRWGITIQEN